MKKNIANRNIREFAARLILLAVLWSAPQTASAAGASLFLFPPSGTYKIGDAFNLYVKIDGGDNPVNAAEGALVYNPKEMEAVSISKSGSFFTL